MAELQHDRAPDQTATDTFAFDKIGLPASGAVVFIRLWTDREGGQPGDVAAKGLDPAVCLAVDLIAASGGAVQNQGKPLVATFPDAPTAILVARRMQWAFQGLSEAEGFAGCAIAALVCSSADLSGKPADHAGLLFLEQGTPGRILLGENVSELVRDIPGLVTKSVSDSVLSELLWGNPESGSRNAAGELTLFRNIKEQGRRSPQPSAEEPLPIPVQASEGAEAVSAESAHLDNLLGDTSAGSFFARLSNSHRLILGGGIASLVCIFAVIMIVFAFHRNAAAPSPNQSSVTAPAVPQAAPTQAPTAAPQAATAAVPQVPAKVATPAASPTEAESTRDRAKRQRETASKQIPAAGGCDIGASGAQRTLQRANNSLHAGKYDEAERDFRSILSCEGTSAQAREGMEQVRERRDAARQRSQ